MIAITPQRHHDNMYAVNTDNCRHRRYQQRQNETGRTVARVGSAAQRIQGVSYNCRTVEDRRIHREAFNLEILIKRGGILRTLGPLQFFFFFWGGIMCIQFFIRKRYSRGVMLKQKSRVDNDYFYVRRSGTRDAE